MAVYTVYTGNWRGDFEQSVSYPNGGTATVNLLCRIDRKGTGTLVGATYTCLIGTSAGGSNVATKTGYLDKAGWTSSGQVRQFASHAISVSRTHAAQTLTYYGSFKYDDGSVASGYKNTGALTVTIAAKASYSVVYNNNGGTGTIPTQTKWYGEALTITTSAPTRSGYTFQGWYDNINGTGQNYAGTSYTANAGITLYAKWTPQTRTITYVANGGTGTIAPQTKTYGENLTLSDGEGFTRTDYTILEWNTQADNSGTTYALSQTLATTFLSDLTLYAQWRLDYTPLAISNTNIHRVASSSSTTETDDGQYIYVGFSYQAGRLPSGNLAPTVNVKVNGTSIYTDTLSASGTTFSMAFGTYSADASYTVEVTLSDTYGSVATTANVSTATYPIDLYGTGTDVYMGIMSPYETGTPLKIHSFKTEDIDVTGDIIFELDDTAGSGTDYEILTALTTLGWDVTPE